MRTFIAIKMAAVAAPDGGLPWPNDKDGYELLGVIGTFDVYENS